MIHKRFLRQDDEDVVRVTFFLPGALAADKISLVGDFNHWDAHAHPLERDRDGDWNLTVTLPLGQVYQFRYRLDNGQWMNDSNADAYVQNTYGTMNFVVVTHREFTS